MPEKAYVAALIADLQQDLQTFSPHNRVIQTIFIGGGTPSLFAPDSIAELLTAIQAYCVFAPDIEITLEANPGTVEQGLFAGFKSAGVNRLSLGIQSFQPEKLQALGRIHNDKEALRAVETVHAAGFDNFNLDIMHGLPNQTAADALFDLQTAMALQPPHLSWYQLTLEPNTAFYRQPPVLPEDDQLADIQLYGQNYLAEQGFTPYEISAYVKSGIIDRRSKHNLNYWQFGDYLGIGAGAHGKVTDITRQTITRYWKTKHPKDYLNPQTPYLAGQKLLSDAELPLEFMMNALRLYQPIPITLFTARTGLPFVTLIPILTRAKELDLLDWDQTHIQTTAQGKQYLNNLLALF